ncbi:hypothetical protein F5Y18DRAFT_429061 [Xylariaceae sp. FL1019]|nr:hypothetical protein F5Y18DRAFT_429061 [Xylariaceae sp. FL1019]
MAHFGRSFKPPSYFSTMSRRPAGPTRSLSNMSSPSEMSPLSSPDLRSDDIVFSARSSPAPPADYIRSPMSPQRYLRTSGTRSPPRSINIDEPLDTSSASSKPIAIELPTVNHANRTPPPPLSARGDLPGGYFPLHEEQARVYRPHPFQLDASKARTKSIQRANKAVSSDLQTASLEDASSSTKPIIAVTSPEKNHPTMEIPRFNLNMANIPSPDSASATHTPVASYMPLGAQDSLPMGKYYPSNYKQRKDAKRKAQIPRPSALEPTVCSTSSKSESQVPTLSQPTSSKYATGHVRNESEARRRLQQYQRDMVAQATLALNGGTVSPATRTSLRSLGFTHIAKPSKPRLAPLGSPGPVTPMELEGSDTGYLGAHGAIDTQDEIARAIRAEEDRSRRENTSSPAIDLGPSSL